MTPPDWASFLELGARGWSWTAASGGDRRQAVGLAGRWADFVRHVSANGRARPECQAAGSPVPAILLPALRCVLSGPSGGFHLGGTTPTVEGAHPAGKLATTSLLRAFGAGVSPP